MQQLLLSPKSLLKSPIGSEIAEKAGEGEVDIP